MAGWTGLEPATFCVTGRRSNQLSYHPVNGTKGYFPDDASNGQEGIPRQFAPFRSQNMAIPPTLYPCETETCPIPAISRQAQFTA
jgi:hypothetical protein